MTSIVSKLMTVADLYALPDDGIHHELVHGRLVSEPPPAPRHGRIAARLVQRLGTHAEEHRLGIVFSNDTGFLLQRGPDTVRAPDVAFVVQSRYQNMADEVSAFPGPPDLAIEVLSPGNTDAAIHAKVADYLAAGTLLVWVVDPDRREVRCYRELLKPEIVSEADALSADDLLPGLTLSVATVFAR